MKWLWFAFSFLIGFLLLMMSNITLAQKSGKKIYENRCASCHKLSNQELVGPGLANVNKRRDQAWLIKFIRNSQKLIKEGDKLANRLYNQYNQTIMPSHTDLSKADILNLLDYIKKESKGVEEQKVLTNKANQSEGGGKAEFPQFSTMPQGKAEKDYKYNPDTTQFQILFWMAASLGILLVLGFTLIVIKFSN
jgi:cytochrome c551/c552